MATYFGQQTYVGDNDTIYNQYKAYKNVTHACPGSGAQSIEALEFYAKAYSGTVYYRLGIYTADGVLVAEGTSQVSMDTTYAWRGYISSGITWRNEYTSLTGGVSYKLAYFVGFRSVIGYQAGTSGDMGYNPGDFSDGMPDPIPTITNSSYKDMIRCGVDPIIAGSILPLIGHSLGGQCNRMTG